MAQWSATVQLTYRNDSSGPFVAYNSSSGFGFFALNHTVVVRGASAWCRRHASTLLVYSCYAVVAHSPCSHLTGTFALCCACSSTGTCRSKHVACTCIDVFVSTGSNECGGPWPEPDRDSGAAAHAGLAGGCRACDARGAVHSLHLRRGLCARRMLERVAEAGSVFADAEPRPSRGLVVDGSRVAGKLRKLEKFILEAQQETAQDDHDQQSKLANILLAIHNNPKGLATRGIKDDGTVIPEEPES